mmetsp:Transcript_16240/g.32913  ORF Transcript_16240/g.32913 Transcript_16240/m.32913 type:complete len:270 (-) Transcript_16240:234-1043(-)
MIIVSCMVYVFCCVCDMFSRIFSPIFLCFYRLFSGVVLRFIRLYRMVTEKTGPALWKGGVGVVHSVREVARTPVSGSLFFCSLTTFAICVCSAAVVSQVFAVTSLCSMTAVYCVACICFVSALHVMLTVDLEEGRVMGNSLFCVLVIVVVMLHHLYCVVHCPVSCFLSKRLYKLFGVGPGYCGPGMRRGAVTFCCFAFRLAMMFYILSFEIPFLRLSLFYRRLVFLCVLSSSFPRFFRFLCGRPLEQPDLEYEIAGNYWHLMYTPRLRP